MGGGASMTDGSGDRDKDGKQKAGRGTEFGVETSSRAIPCRPRAKRDRLPATPAVREVQKCRRRKKTFPRMEQTLTLRPVLI